MELNSRSVLAASVLLGALVLGSSLSPAGPMPVAQYADDVFGRLQEARTAADADRLERRADLDAVAQERAATVAALPHKQRLAVEQPVAELLAARGVKRYRHALLHVDLLRGYPNPPAAFFRNWNEHSSWTRVLDPRYRAVGLATVQAEDGWVVLVSVLLEPMRLPADLGVVEREVWTRVNAERRGRGLPELVEEPWVAEVAREHSRDMVRRRFFGHRSPEGRGVEDRVRAAGYEFRRLAENVYRGKGTAADAEAAVLGWLESAGHRRNLLGQGFVRTGIGVAVDEDGFVYYTQVFVAP